MCCNGVILSESACDGAISLRCGIGGGLAAHPRAQQIGQVARIVLWLGGLGPSDPETQRVAAAFRESMHGLGWADGRNLRIDLRWIGAAFSAQEMRAAAAETISLSPDVVVTTGAPILAALQSETKTIPLVFTFVTDPVSDGFVASLARPGRQYHWFHHL